MKRGADEVARRLADMGFNSVSIKFQGADYDGRDSHDITVQRLGSAKYKVEVRGTAVLFIEFGSGLVGYGHPELHGYGPGTYPGKGNWNNPKGWYFTDPLSGQSVHSYGNPPNAPVYETVKELEAELERVVREVFDD